MQLNEWKKYLYKPTRDLNEISNKFIHYWTNEGENYPDVDNIEDYLSENYGDTYSWHYEENLRIEKNTIDTLKIELGLEELYENKTIFLKLVDPTGKEIPQYFYATRINQTSDQNYNSTSYSIICELDAWATFGCRMKYWMSQNDCTEKFLFFRKMCNRFYKLINTAKYFWLDYLQMPWLMQTGNYVYGLIRNKEEERLTLNNWLWMNSGYIDTKNPSEWLRDIWQPWVTANYPSSQIKLSENISTGIETYQIKYESEDTKDINKVQNVNLANLSFDDSLFNSNGKYRYFNLKLGNFTLPKGKFDEDIEPSNGAIKTESVIGQKVIEDETLSTWYTAISGETLCMIPIPKGTNEQKWLFALNTTDNGMILGNGSVLGMVLNDIPPSVLALSLRTFADEQNCQPIGDELSFRKIYNIVTDQVYTSPAALTSLHFDRVNNPVITDWTRHDFEKQTWEPHEDTWYKVWASPEYFGIYLAQQYETMPSNKMDILLQPNRGNEPIVPDVWYDVIDPETGENWAFLTFVHEQGISDDTQWVYLRFESPDGLYATNGWRKKNWKVLVSRPDVVEVEGAWPPIAKKIDPTKWYLRDIDKPEDKVLYTGNEELNIPCIFNDFGYIPINIAISPKYSNYNENNPIIGGTQFFNSFYNMLKDADLEEEKLNIPENEPLLYSPAFWQWIYYIDGLHKIILTADMIDFAKFTGYSKNKSGQWVWAEPIWNVKLNVNMTSHTGYKLDIDKIKNDLYPWTRSTTELISTDMIQLPSTTESYNDWRQHNFATQETSKNAKNIDQNWARINLPFNIVGSFLGSTGEGASVGASIGGGYGAAIGAAVGSTKGTIESGFMGLGLYNAIKQMDEQWNNRWQGTISNMYSAPTHLNPSGFTAGSLIYSPSLNAAEDTIGYELFKTFCLTQIARNEIWDDVSSNGYFFKSECLFKDYKNRKKFNILNCNFNNKDFYVDTYLRDKMLSYSMIFSQQMFIDWFKMKCKQMIRLFIADFNSTEFSNLIKYNTEISYEIPDEIK